MNEEDVKLEGFEEGTAETQGGNEAEATNAVPAEGEVAAVAAVEPTVSEGTAATKTEETPAVEKSTSSVSPEGLPPSPRAGKARDEPVGTIQNKATETAQNEQTPQGQAVQQPSHRPMESDAVEKAQPQVVSERNLMAGFKELARVHPEVTKQPLPEDIFQAIVMGEQSPLSVYEGMMMRKLSAEIETLRKENQTLRQNAETAAKAPVKASTGAPQTEAQDEFLKGFNLGR